MVSFSHLAVLLVVLVLGVGFLLLLLWPRARSGVRLLRNWGVPEPTSEQGEVARRYLLSRRLLYVVFFVLAGPLDGLVVLAVGRSYFPSVGWFLAALLLAELIAMLRPVRGEVRVATLTRRSIGDVVPRWMIAVHVVTVVAAVVGAVVLDTQAGRDLGLGPMWPEIVLAIGSAVAVYAVAWLAVARPAVGDAQVDQALRLRSARVMMGIGTLFAATLLSGVLSLLATWNHDEATSVAAVLAQVFGLVAWGWMASVFAFWSGFRGQVPVRNG
jgi:hypothetical protein